MCVCVSVCVRCMALLCMPTFIASQNQTLTLPWGQHDAAHQQQQPGTELAPASASSPEQPGTARGLSNGCANMGVPCSKIEAGIGSTGQAGGIGDDRPELEPAPSMQPLTLPGAGDLARMTRFEAVSVSTHTHTHTHMGTRVYSPARTICPACVAFDEQAGHISRL